MSRSSLAWAALARAVLAWPGLARPGLDSGQARLVNAGTRVDAFNICTLTNPWICVSASSNNKHWLCQMFGWMVGAGRMEASVCDSREHSCTCIAIWEQHCSSGEVVPRKWFSDHAVLFLSY